jgi:hypothetical protein
MGRGVEKNIIYIMIGVYSMNNLKHFIEIQSDKELDKFMEDDNLSENEFHLWQLEYAIKNNDLDLLDRIIEEKGC